MTEAFERYFLNEPPKPDANDIRVWQFAEQYHAECDLYDEQVCTGINKKTGEAMPVNQDEFKLVNRNAKSTRARLAAEAGMSTSEFSRVCNDFSMKRRR